MSANKYPKLLIDQTKLYENAKMVVDLCGKHPIKVAGVIKGVNGHLAVAEAFCKAGCEQIASSRIEQLAAVKKACRSTKTMLLRVPMLSELEDLVAVTDYSLNSERDTLDALEKVCEKLSIKHKVILMMDLGDLREGYFTEEEVIQTASYIEHELNWVEIAGIGTNLGCYGAIKPTELNLGRLADTAVRIEALIGRKLEIVSGGATSSLPLLVAGRMPLKINHLRIGEGILLNMDLPEIWNVKIADLHQDPFVLQAQIIEIKYKPSHPVGEIFIDAFGATPTYEDRGVRRRAILGVGKQDFAMDEKLVPMDPGVSIIGSSSDHLIVEIDESVISYKIGDLMSFTMYYGPMLHLSTCPYVATEVVNGLVSEEIFCENCAAL